MTINSKNVENEIAAEHKNLINSQAIQPKIRTVFLAGKCEIFFFLTGILFLFFFFSLSVFLGS